MKGGNLFCFSAAATQFASASVTVAVKLNKCCFCLNSYQILILIPLIRLDTQYQ